MQGVVLFGARERATIGVKYRARAREAEREKKARGIHLCERRGCCYGVEFPNDCWSQI